MAASKIASAMGSRFRTWPIGETAALHGELAALGLKLPAAAIDGTGPDADASALSNALVSVGASGRGGTGSFISKSGLIVTNHHVALDAVRSASRRAGVDYLEDGFVAKRRADEVATESYECWITRRCEDVSAAVVEAAGAEADPLKRALAFRDAALKTAKDREAGEAGGARCEVKATWPERTYTLFVYERLSDVRLVYVPPRSLGNFGGDVDNFEWPRHTADFALLRAYGADGRPYAPSAHLRTAPGGADAGDFVFLLGFPGRTTRYAPASRLKYAETVAVPSLCRDFRRKLDLMERALDEDEGRAPPPAPAAAAPRIASYAAAEPRRAVPKMVDLGVTAKTRGKPTYPKKAPPAPAPPAAGGGCRLKIAAAKKSLANELKRSSGKRAMLRRVGLVAEREAEEQALVAAAPAARPLLDELAAVYARLEATAGRRDALEKLTGVYHGSALLATASALYDAAIESAKPDDAREAYLRERNLDFTAARLAKRLDDVHAPLEAALVLDALTGSNWAALYPAPRAPNLDLAFNADRRDVRRDVVGLPTVPVDPVDEGAVEAALALPMHLNMVHGMTPGGCETLEAARSLVDKSKLRKLGKDELRAMLAAPKDMAWEVQSDVFMGVIESCYPPFLADRDETRALVGRRDRLCAELLDLQRGLDAGEPAYPDCNGSLRLSAGFVEGYSPCDAVVHAPRTTLGGLVDKADDAASRYEAGDARARDFAPPARFLDLVRGGARDTPANVLYSTDTLGGNSGSPVLDAAGRFVAINFDRQRPGLVNEYKYDPRYSRSIGVDVRMILWLVGTYDGAADLVAEMLEA